MISPHFLQALGRFHKMGGQQDGLANPVRANYAADLALADLKRYLVHGDSDAIGFP